jgi:methionyl-tRNA formyltransferase
VRLVDITSKSEVWIILVGPDGTEAVLKIYEAEKLALSPKPCGMVVTDGKSHLYIYTVDGALSIRTLQLAGKKRMEVGDFLRGSRLGDGYRVE